MHRISQRLLAIPVFLCALVSPAAWAQFGWNDDDGASPPISSAQVEGLLAKLDADPAFRAAAGKALDAYVKRWQALRDGELRTAVQAKRDTEAAMRAARAQAQEQGAKTDDAPAPMPATGMGRQYAAAVERLGRVRAQVRDGEAELFKALRDAAPERAKSSIEDAALLRRRRIAAACAEILWSVPLRLPRVPDELLTDPQVKDAVQARLRAWSKAATEELERGCRVRSGLATPEDMARNQEVATAADGTTDWLKVEPTGVYRRSQMAAIADIAKLLPATGREAWLRSARRSLAAWVMSVYPNSVPSERVRAEIGDRMNAEGQARFDRWLADREVLDQRALDTNDWSERSTIGEQLKALDAAALADLSKSTGTESIGRENFAEDLTREQAAMPATTVESLEADRDEDLTSRVGWGRDSTMERIRSRTAAALGEDATEEGAPTVGGEPAMEQMVALRSLKQADTVAIRDRLGIPDARHELWDTLANDALAQTEAARAESSEAFGKLMRFGDGGNSGEEGLAARRRFMAAAGAAEERWFDAIAAAFPEVGKESIDAERGRRALRRTVEASALMLMLSRYSGNRWIDVDLDLATDGLSPAARAKAASALSDWRLRKAAAIDAIVAATERLMERMMQMAKARPDGQDAMTQYQEAMARYKRDADETSRRGRAEQLGAIETIADALGGREGAAFRRAVQRRAFPEIYRAQDSAEAIFDRAMADPSIPAERKVEIAEAWDRLTTGFDPIAARLIKASEASEEAMGNMMGGASDDGMVDRVQDASHKAAELAAAEYDAEELRAHAARRLREINALPAR